MKNRDRGLVSLHVGEYRTNTFQYDLRIISLCSINSRHEPMAAGKLGGTRKGEKKRRC